MFIVSQHKMSGPAKKPFNFSWVIPGVLAGSGLPSDASHIQFFLNEGIKHLVSLTEWKPSVHVYPGNFIHECIQLSRYLCNPKHLMIS